MLEICLTADRNGHAFERWSGLKGTRWWWPLTTTIGQWWCTANDTCGTGTVFPRLYFRNQWRLALIKNLCFFLPVKVWSRAAILTSLLLYFLFSFLFFFLFLLFCFSQLDFLFRFLFLPSHLFFSASRSKNSFTVILSVCFSLLSPFLTLSTLLLLLALYFWGASACCNG